MIKIEEIGHHIKHGKRRAYVIPLLGKASSTSLCYSCKLFKPNQPDNCIIAQGLFEHCVEHGLTTPVWECASFIHKEQLKEGEVKRKSGFYGKELGWD